MLLLVQWFASWQLLMWRTLRRYCLHFSKNSNYLGLQRREDCVGAY